MAKHTTPHIHTHKAPNIQRQQSYTKPSDTTCRKYRRRVRRNLEKIAEFPQKIRRRKGERTENRDKFNFMATKVCENGQKAAARGGAGGGGGIRETKDLRGHDEFNEYVKKGG